MMRMCKDLKRSFTEWKWDAMTERARRLERDRAELMEALRVLVDIASDGMTPPDTVAAIDKTRHLLQRLGDKP